MRELRATTRLSYKELQEEGQYEVWQRQNQVHKEHRLRKYNVITDLSNGREDYSCICAKFNKDGILCRHILKIMVETEVSQIPEKYIIQRWRKTQKKINLNREPSNTPTDEILRFNILSREAAELTSQGAKKEEAMQYLMKEFSKIKKNLDLILSQGITTIPEMTTVSEHAGAATLSEPGGAATQISHNAATDEPQPSENESNIQETELNIQDPEAIQRKGRPEKPKRFKDMVEQEREKIKKAQEKKQKAAEKKKAKNAETSSKHFFKKLLHTNQYNPTYDYILIQTDTAGPNPKNKKKQKRMASTEL
jgi:hypothetical protein